MKQVSKVTVSLDDNGNFDRITDIFESGLPARSAIAVDALPEVVGMEIEPIATN